jgi:hypothetical protein
MNRSMRNLLVFITVFQFAFSVFSQSVTTSPYSRYGIGEINDKGYAQSFSMAGLGTAIQNDTLTPFNINLSNPASFPYTRLTTFETGLTSNTSKLTSPGQTQVTNATSFGYIAFAFPITKWWGSGFGLQPMSGVGYNVTDSKNIDSIGTVNYVYNGSGGINKVFWGNGFKVGGLSFGANASYLFGLIEHNSKAIMPPGNGYYNSKIIRRTNVSDFYFDYGVQYGFTIDSLRHRDLRDNVRIVWGATFAAMSDINVINNVQSENYIVNGYNYDVPRDTIQIVKYQKSFIRMPSKFSTGITLRKGDKFTIGVEYSMQNWSTFEFSALNGGLKNSTKFIAGMQYIPSRRSEVNIGYLKKVYYRAGFRYSNLPIDINGTQITETAFTFGFGLPVGWNRHMMQYNILNVGFELGQRGSESVLKEQFFNVIFGISLNDRWFVKSKID